MFSLRDNAMTGQWLGRKQTLAGGMYYLFEEGRARHAAQEARRAAEWEEEKADRAAEKE